MFEKDEKKQNQIPPQDLPPSYEETLQDKNDLESGRDEIWAHFLLIQAMDKFLGSYGDYGGIDSEGLLELKQNYQQSILTLGARRFIIFVSALKQEFPSGKGLQQFMNTAYPPMEVLMIWYTLFSRPRSSLHELKAGNFTEFLNYPFPLIRVATYIDQRAFAYQPNSEQKASYIGLIERYYGRNKIDEEFDYEILGNFNPYAAVFPVYCPSCGDFLTNTKLTTPDHKGFSDAQFSSEASECSCGFPPFVDHNNLLIRQLYKDVMNPGDSKFISTFDLNLTRLHFNETSKFGLDQLSCLREEFSTLKLPAISVEVRLHQMFQHSSNDTKLLLREYLFSNLIHVTIPQHSVIQIHRDLVGMFMISGVFFDTFLDYVEHFGSKAVLRHISSCFAKYERFFSLYKDSNQLLSPTFDVEFIWRTFRLNQPRYFDACMRKVNRLVNYDAIEEVRLLKACFTTSEAFEKKFKEKLCFCNCEYCFLAMDKSYRFGKKPDTNLCLSHFPRSDSVSSDRDRSMRLMRHQKHGKWRDTGVEPMYEVYPAIFSVPIHSLFEVAPIDYFQKGSFGPQEDTLGVWE